MPRKHLGQLANALIQNHSNAAFQGQENQHTNVRF